MTYNKFSKFYSKEHSNQSFRPYLEVDYDTERVQEHAPRQIAGQFLEAYPNPFNPSTQIVLRTTTPGQAILTVYDLAGRQVAELHRGWLSTGNHSITWNAAGFTSGVYFLHLQAGNAIQVKKLMLVE